MFTFLLFGILVVLLGICYCLAQIVVALATIAASLHVDALKKAGIVDEIRAAVLRRIDERREGAVKTV